MLLPERIRIGRRSLSPRAANDVARLLLEHGADPTLAEDDRFTPLDAAVANGNTELAELLRTHLGV